VAVAELDCVARVVARVVPELPIDYVGAEFLSNASACWQVPICHYIAVFSVPLYGTEMLLQRTFLLQQPQLGSLANVGVGFS